MHLQRYGVFDGVLGVAMDMVIGKRRGDTERTGAPRAFRAGAARSVALLFSLIVSGCSIHPVQQEVTGVPPVEIIHHIRCETRLAIQDKAIELLINYRNGQYEPAKVLAKSLLEKRGQKWNFDPRSLTTQEERAFYNRYILTGIAYDFTLDILEDDRGALLADPVRLITNGVAGVGLGVSGEFSRNNARRFIMSDTFAKLLADENLRCGDRESNFAYPIAGRIGMKELISTFVDLNEDQSLQTLELRFAGLRRHDDVPDDGDRIGKPACRDHAAGQPMGFGKPHQPQCFRPKDR